MRNKPVFLFVLGFLLLAAAACSPQAVQTGSAGSASAADQSMVVEVSISNFAFAPADLEVKVGTTVTWTNLDSVEHTVTANDGAFDSGLFGKDAAFSYTFQEAGSFPYYCIPHPNMIANVKVVP